MSFYSNKMYHNGYVNGRRIAEHFPSVDIRGVALFYDAIARTTTIVSRIPDAKPEMSICPVCKSNKDVVLASYPGSGSHFCNDFECECLWFTPTPDNAKLADAALDSLPVGRYQTPVRKPYSTEFTFDEFVPVTTATQFELNLMEHVKHLQGQLKDGPISDERFRSEFARRFPFVDADYVQTMNEVGLLGEIKHGDKCIEQRVRKGDFSRYGERVYRSGFRLHSDGHWREYVDGVTHDAFGTLRHQLGAVGYNAQLEFKLSRLAGEGADTVETSLDIYRTAGERA